ncbi:MAG: FdtA/QdtA family cupin domain-containing protein [Daejeonella sp.]
MAKLVHLKTVYDERGSLTVLDRIDELIPFLVKRIFFINAFLDVVRGGHRHRNTKQAIICINGTCTVSNHDGKKQEDLVLDSPEKCLFLETYDWHIMHEFSSNAILLVLASESFDVSDYIYEPYPDVSA